MILKFIFKIAFALICSHACTKNARWIANVYTFGLDCAPCKSFVAFAMIGCGAVAILAVMIATWNAFIHCTVPIVPLVAEAYLRMDAGTVFASLTFWNASETERG